MALSFRNYYLTNPKEQSPSWEANSRSFIQEISRLLRLDPYPKLHESSPQLHALFL
jgi:hypothetical protein